MIWAVRKCFMLSLYLLYTDITQFDSFTYFNYNNAMPIITKLARELTFD